MLDDRLPLRCYANDRLVRIARSDGPLADAATFQLLDNHRPLINAIVRDLRTRVIAGGHAWEVDSGDLLSVAHLAFLEALKRFDPDRGVTIGAYARTWIYGAVRRYVYGEAKYRARLVVTETTDNGVFDRPVEDVDLSRVDAVDAREGVRRFILNLTPRQQQIVYLRFYGDLAQAEIARTLRVTPMAVSKTLSAIYKSGQRHFVFWNPTVGGAA